MGPRSIRSFVLRSGRLTDAQQRAMLELWPRYGVSAGEAWLDLASLYGRRAPCTLEIGFGNGEHLAARSLAEPERDFLGVEVHRPGIGHLLHTAAARGIVNLRVIDRDAVDVLRAQIAPGSLDEVQILFPDPWPKKRHHKRRLIQPEFTALLATRLTPGGRLHLATDWDPYAAQMRMVLAGCSALAAMPSQPATGREATRFEQRGLRLGHRVSEFVYRRVA